MDSSSQVPSRDDLAAMYLDTLPYAPYRVQEDALLAWFSQEQGILVCAPTGTGKTLIAEAAMFEAMHTRKTAYYTTPLIALTEQKFQELQESAIRWGFDPNDVGLITGNRKVNPQAPVLVVVAEILLNRLLHPEGIDFSNVASVVMDEFHSFNDPERGVVWELSLALLPPHVRLMLLSATVGNAVDFLLWLRQEHGRKVQLIQGTERKVPLDFNWVGTELLPDYIEQMHDGTDETRRTPALIFCFNREECWTTAEQLKGKSLLRSGQQKELAERLDKWDWKIGAGPKLKQLLLRGVGVHHAGLLPKYRRRVERLFQDKLLSVCVCTETLAAGINLPARSVVMTSLLKGPPGKKSVIDASSAHQIFGRAGRPQYDDRGYVFALAHEDDVKIARWKEQYDQIPEDTKDPNLIRMKKKLKKKMPTRRSNEQYWNEDQFQKLIASPPAHLVSKGQLPWRLLAYLLKLSPDVTRLLRFVKKRLLPPKQKEKADQRLVGMLKILEAGDFLVLDPPPPNPIPKVQRDWAIPESLDVPERRVPAEVDDGFGDGLFEETKNVASTNQAESEKREETEPEPDNAPMGLLGTLLQEALEDAQPVTKKKQAAPPSKPLLPADEEPEPYVPITATPTDRLDGLLHFRSCHPLYGNFLLDHLGIADRAERLQILESILEVPGSMIRNVRVPPPDQLPPGPLAVHRIDPELIARGLITAAEIDPSAVEPETDNFGREIRQWHVPLGDKVRRLFDSEFPGVQDLRIRSAWIAGDLLLSGLDFHKFVTTRDLTKQEGIVFRHLLRLILLCDEFEAACPVGMDVDDWKAELDWIRDTLTEVCREVDPESTDSALESMAAQADIVGDD
ncbi:MAG: DEAD/DEAH box helicase [Planctomycetaceae bacterium]|nr:DEAD/DEAH box helicase [Planctomycetaceae bacterium]